LPVSSRGIALVALRRLLAVWVEPDRLGLSGGVLVGSGLVGEPLPKIGGKVNPKGYR
jgi:hypothetical protein